MQDDGLFKSEILGFGYDDERGTLGDLADQTGAFSRDKWGEILEDIIGDEAELEPEEQKEMLAIARALTV
jgi:hypothetical protein